MSAVPSEQASWVELDGFLYDSSTGERVGHLDATGEQRFYEGAVNGNVWVPSSREDLEFLLRKRQHLAELRVGKKAAYEAACILMDKELKRIEGDIQRFDFIWESDVARLAKQFLPVGRRIFESPFGVVKFVRFPSDIEQDNPDACLRWAKRHCKNAVKTPPPPPPSFMISKVPLGIIQALLLKTDKQLARLGFKRKPEGERVKIDSMI